MWHARRVIADRGSALALAIVEEACRKSALIWLRPDGADRSYPAWHVWVGGAVHVVSGGLEQPLPELPDGSTVDVTARSKDTGGRIVTFRATVTSVTPDDEVWGSVVSELHAKRLNPPDGEAQPDRWARESHILRLEPTGELVEGPGHLPHRSHAAEPPVSPATTLGPLPFVVGRRARRRR
jgi:hypothetical protein